MEWTMEDVDKKMHHIPVNKAMQTFGTQNCASMCNASTDQPHSYNGCNAFRDTDPSMIHGALEPARISIRLSKGSIILCFIISVHETPMRLCTEFVPAAIGQELILLCIFLSFSIASSRFKRKRRGSHWGASRKPFHNSHQSSFFNWSQSKSRRKWKSIPSTQKRNPSGHHCCNSVCQRHTQLFLCIDTALCLCKKYVVAKH